MLRPARVSKVLGADISADDIVRYLESVRFVVERVDAATLRVSPPSWRRDVTRDVDLIEEVARLHGYDHIPESTPAAALELRPAVESMRSRDDFAHILVNRDFQEVMTYSFVDPAWEHDYAGSRWRIRCPRRCR